MSEPIVSDVAEFLGAKPNEKTLNLACENEGEQGDMVETVTALGAKYNDGDSLSIELLMDAARRNDLYTIKLYMEAGAKHDNLAMETVLFDAIYLQKSDWQKSEIIDYIINIGFKPNLETFDNAIQTKNLDTINYMINLGAKPNKFSINRARTTRHPKIIELVKSLPVVNASNMNWYKQAIEYRHYDPEWSNDDLEDDDWTQGLSPEELATQGEKTFNESKIRPDSTKDIRDLALEDGTVIGATSSGWHTDENDYYIFAFDIAVKEKFRGQGIGTNLIERALEEFESERYIYEETGQKTAMRLEAINVKLGEFIIRNYGFKLEKKLPDRIILYKE